MSLGYFLVKLVLKIRGEKKSWSIDPIDYIKKRKEDIKLPTTRLLEGNTADTTTILQTKISSIRPIQLLSDYLLFYCHGGAFIYGPTEANWKSISSIVKHTGTEAWMVDYPKAPESNIKIITENVYAVYQKALEKYEPSKIILIGDSVGGNLITSLTQILIEKKQKVPNSLILITPMMDASLTNPQIPKIELIDPILSYRGVYSAKKMCADGLSLKDPLISPLYGMFHDLPPIYIFMGTNDILMPDQKLFIQKVEKEGSTIEVILGKGMPHIWPLLPVFKEGVVARRKIISIIKELAGV